MAMSNEKDGADKADDIRLLRAAQSGDRAAMEQLLTAHQDRIYRTALAYLGGNEEGATEVAQDVLISVARNLPGFRGDSRLTTWLYRMTINYAKNYLTAKIRRQSRLTSLDASKRGSDDQVHTADATDPTPGPTEKASAEEMQRLVRERLVKLPDEFRTVMVLRFVEEQSYEEIAESLAIPVGTVKSRINRGRAELRQLMADVLPRGGVNRG